MEDGMKVYNAHDLDTAKGLRDKAKEAMAVLSRATDLVGELINEDEMRGGDYEKALEAAWLAAADAYDSLDDAILAYEVKR